MAQTRITHPTGLAVSIILAALALLFLVAWYLLRIDAGEPGRTSTEMEGEALREEIASLKAERTHLLATSARLHSAEETAAEASANALRLAAELEEAEKTCDEEKAVLKSRIRTLEERLSASADDPSGRVSGEVATTVTPEREPELAEVLRPAGAGEFPALDLPHLVNDPNLLDESPRPAPCGRGPVCQARRAGSLFSPAHHPVRRG